MIIVLVKYKEWTYTIEKSKVVEVDKLTDLNNMFLNITDIKILKEE